MQLLSIIVLLLATFICFCFAFPVPADIKDSPKEAKSAFGQPFDEIVVESSLTVKRKSGNRQSRNKDVVSGANASISAVKKERRSIGNRYNPLSPL